MEKQTNALVYALRANDIKPKIVESNTKKIAGLVLAHIDLHVQEFLQYVDKLIKLQTELSMESNNDSLLIDAVYDTLNKIDELVKKYKIKDIDFLKEVVNRKNIILETIQLSSPKQEPVVVEKIKDPKDMIGFAIITSDDKVLLYNKEKPDIFYSQITEDTPALTLNKMLESYKNSEIKTDLIYKIKLSPGIETDISLYSVRTDKSSEDFIDMEDIFILDAVTSIEIESLAQHIVLDHIGDILCCSL